MTRAEKEWEVYSGKYRTYIKTERGLAANTVEAYMRDLRRFRRFVTERYRLSPLEVETPVVEEFLNSLFEAGAEKSTQNRTLSGVSSFYDFLLRTDVLEMKDLKPGMILTGTVRNVIDFGVFVDIGVHQDGLVHISQVCDKFIRHPSEAVSVGDVVKVVVLEVDEKKKRISLSMKQAK